MLRLTMPRHVVSGGDEMRRAHLAVSSLPFPGTHSVSRATRRHHPETPIAMYTRRLVALISVVAATTACIVDINAPGSTNHNIDIPAVANSPAVAASSSGFGFAVLASNFAFDDEYVTTIASSDLRLTIALSQYGGGMARVEIRDAGNTIVFAQQYSGNVAQSIADVHGTAPFRVHLSFSTFNGSFAASLAPR